MAHLLLSVGEPITESYIVSSLPNVTEAITFYDAMIVLTDRTVIVTFDDNQNANPIVTVSVDDNIVAANGTLALTGTGTDPRPDTRPSLLSLDSDAEHRNIQRRRRLNHNLDSPRPDRQRPPRDADPSRQQSPTST